MINGNGNGGGHVSLGLVSPEERDEIQKLNQRKQALLTAIHALGKISDEVVFNRLYVKLIEDLGQTQYAFDAWWKTMASKYQWPPSTSGWNINFETCEIRG